MRFLPIALCWVVALPSLGWASDWYVDDDNCPGGSGSLGDPFCTISQAIAAASDGDSIHVLAGTYTENLTVNKSLTFRGASSETTTIDGAQAGSVMRILADNTVTVENLSLVGGHASEGGGVHCHGSLSMTDCVLRNNTATVNGGGGLYFTSEGTLTLTRCVLRENEAPVGGGIRLSAGIATVSRCAISDNQGGGIFNLDGDMDLSDCHIDGNEDGAGGGINNKSGGRVELIRCTLSRNTATAVSGGGVLNLGTCLLTNCTVSANRATIRGGGILNEAGSMTLDSCTITANIADVTSGGLENFGTLLIGDTIAAGNDAPVAPDCSGFLTSTGYNLFGSFCSIDGDPTGNLYNTDPLLGPLADTGGLTPTHTPLRGSPAIDAGNPTQCQSEDQRGSFRPVDGDGDGTTRCDIGSVETCRFSLTAEPPRVQAGTELSLSSCGGVPLHLAMMFVVTINDVPLYRPIVLSAFDDSGLWELEFVVPNDPSLPGNDIAFQTFSTDASSHLIQTNPETVEFR